jgi:hypothetical protein
MVAGFVSEEGVGRHYSTETNGEQAGRRLRSLFERLVVRLRLNG